MHRRWGEGFSDTFEKKWQTTGIEAKWAEEEHRAAMDQLVSLPTRSAGCTALHRGGRQGCRPIRPCPACRWQTVAAAATGWSSCSRWMLS